MSDENGANPPQNGSLLQLQAPEEAAATIPKAITPTPGNSRTCGVCSINAAKYKCTLCGLPYCSIPCNVEHKANHPPIPETETPKEPEMESNPATQKTIKSAPQPGTLSASNQSHILSPLLSSPELQRLFNSYPSLKEQLGDIYDTSQPPHEGRFSRSTSNVQNKVFWTKEQGIRDGTDALKEAKSKFGKDGEGVREFAELVVRLISPENVVNGNFERIEGEQGGFEMGSQEDNATMIAQLLRGDLGGS